MSKDIEWLESFTGVSVASGEAIPDADPDAAAARFEFKRKQQRLMLARVRRELGGFKTEFQDAMSEKIKSGKLKGEQLLKESATQTEEIEAEDLRADDLVLNKETKALIGKGATLVARIGLELEEATFTYEGETGPLFDVDEMREEFWTPVMRERILPETYIPAQYSETQRMLDETTAAYLNRVEQERAQGTLTPRLDRGKEILNSACDVLMLAGDMVGKFGAGTDQAKLAVTVLNTTAAVLKQGSEVYDKATAGQYADASATAFETMGSIATAVLGGFGVDANATAAVGKAFTAGSKAILVGNAFAKGIDGAEDGLTLMGGVVQSALDAAIGLTDGPAKTALEACKATVPALFKQAAIGMQLRQKIIDEDYAGIVNCLGTSFSNVLGSVQELRALNEMEGRSPQEQKEISDRLDSQRKDIEKFGQMGVAGLQMTINAAIAAKRGAYLDALNGVIDGVGAQRTGVLTSVGVDEAQAKMIGQFYIAASSAPKALKCLANRDCDVNGALGELSAGILVAFNQAAPGNVVLQQAGMGLAMSLRAVGTGLKTKEHFDKGNYTDALDSFTDGLKSQLGDVFKLSGVDAGDEEEDSEGDGDESGEGADGGDSEASIGDQTSALIDSVNEQAKAVLEGKAKAPTPQELMADLARAAKLVKKGGKLEANLEEARKKLEAEQKKAAAEAIRAEAEDVLAEAQADADSLTEAQRFGAEASSIDKLVAKLQRDRMVLELATQIAQGGASFLAKFVPVLGAVAAGIKLAAQLHAAGLRAQQLYRWVKAQDDLEAAQSSLSSSAGNFVRNQGEQLAHYAAQALFAAAQLAAECVKLSGIAAPVGMGLDAAATAGAKLEEIARKHFRQEDLEKAWEVTVQALRNPTNRKMGLDARRLNPSLAKYAMAWGAKELGDPLARNALRACNLTDASFEDKDTDVDKVVYYLETFYSEDLKLYRELDTAPDWIPKDLTLSLPSWARLKRRAVAEGKLVEMDSGRLDGALAQLDLLAEGPAWEKFKTAHLSWSLAVKSLGALEGGSGAKLKGSPPKVDNTEVVQALAEVETEVSVKTRLITQVQGSFKGLKPAAAPEVEEEAATASVKAMTLAINVLLDQAGVLAGAAEGEMQTVLKLRLQVVPA